MVAVDRPISIPGTRSLVRTQADGAAARIAALMTAQPGTVGVRLGMANDWGSATGFSYTLSFVSEGDEDASDELIELPGGARVFIERKALWVGEGGLVGATMDLDADFNLVITPKETAEGS